MTDRRPVQRLGDSALVANVGTFHEAHRLSASVRAASWDGIEDVIVGYTSVTFVVNPRVADLDSLVTELGALELGEPIERTRRTFEIPVEFGGPDLEHVAMLAGISPEHVVEVIVSTQLEAAFLGFAPGFAYLVGLPEVLAGVPRRSTPRPVVAAGSVALGGGFAAIYPQRSPGGWHVVGRTNRRMFDPETPPFTLLQPGDLVRFVQVGSSEPGPPSERPSLRSSRPRVVEVVQPGFMSLVEDAGRFGVGALGVPSAGGADPFSLRLANRLVGNGDGAAAIEVTGLGPELQAGSAVHVAIVGDVDVQLDGRPVPSNTLLPLEPRQVLKVGAVRKGLRGYIAFDGGLDLPVVLGSRSTDTLCGLGCGPLRAGDMIGLGPPGRPRGRLIGPPSSIGSPKLRVLLGPEEFGSDQVTRLVTTEWEVGSDSDRVGVRFVGDALVPPHAAVASRGTVTGAVQVPPDGAPIALLCDHATVGGYPVIAVVITADLGVLGQLRPGDLVRFEVVSPSDARETLEAAERALDARVTGWYPSRAG